MEFPAIQIPSDRIVKFVHKKLREDGLVIQPDELCPVIAQQLHLIFQTMGMDERTAEKAKRLRLNEYPRGITDEMKDGIERAFAQAFSTLISAV